MSFNCKLELQAKSFIFIPGRLIEKHTANILTESSENQELHSCHSFIQYLRGLPVCRTMPLAVGLSGEWDTVLALEELLPVGEAVREIARK